MPDSATSWPAVSLVPLEPDALAAVASGGAAGSRAVRGWPHRETLPLLAAAAEAGAPAWLVTVDGLVAGECAVKGAIMPGGAAEVGYGLAPSCRGRGYGSRMVGELARAVHELGVAELRAETAATNVASRRALERAGFRVEHQQGGPMVTYVLG